MAVANGIHSYLNFMGQMHTSALIQLPAEPVPRDEVSKALSLKPVQFPSHLWLKQAVFGTIHLFPITFPYLPSLDPCQPSGRQLLQQSLGCCCTMISALQSPIIYFKPRGWTSLKKKKKKMSQTGAENNYSLGAMLALSRPIPLCLPWQTANLD